MKKLVLAIGLAWALPIISPTISGSVVIAQEKKAVWIDVRTPAEWDTGHIEGAILIPYDKIADEIVSVVKNKKQPIKLYCRSGNRANVALETLRNLGYTNVKNLGGYQNLKSQGY